MTAAKVLLDVLRGKSHHPPPVWLMRQAGRYLPEYRATRSQAGGFLDLCYMPSFATEVTLQPIRRYDFDAAILFCDILVIPDGLGQRVSFTVGEGPKLTPLLTRQDIAALEPEHVRPYLKPVYEAVALIAQQLPKKTSFIGFCGGPWTVATYMIEGGGSKDYAKSRQWAFGRPDDLDALLTLLVAASIEHLCAQIEAGVEALQIFDSWAGVLPEEQFRRFVIEPTRAIVEGVQARHPAVPIIGFPRGSGILYEAFFHESGVNAISLDQTVPLAWAAKTLQPIGPVQGNIDPLLLVVGGEALDRAVDRVISVLSEGPLIFNLGHGIVPETPPENVNRLLERIRQS